MRALNKSHACLSGERLGFDKSSGTWDALVMKLPLQIAVAFLSAGLSVSGAVAQEKRCGLALVLSTDVSSSIDAGEYYLQMNGIARAFRSRVLREAILAQVNEPVIATVVQWSGYSHQSQVVPWTRLDSEAALSGFAKATASVPRGARDQPTALAKGLEFSAKLLHGMPCRRRVIDLSGDGVTNWGVEPSYFAERGVFDGMTINGLVIKGATPDPEPYYRENVMRGPGAFVMVARDYEDYPEAILEKLLREIVPQVSARTTDAAEERRALSRDPE
jgi:hypothetical protein